MQPLDARAGHGARHWGEQARLRGRRSPRPSCRYACQGRRPRSCGHGRATLSTSTPSGSEKGCRPTLAMRVARRRDRRLVGHRRKGIGRRMARLGAGPNPARRAPGRAPRRAHTRARARRNRTASPASRRRDSSIGREVLGAVADQHRAVEFRVAADVIVVAGVEWLRPRRRAKSPPGERRRAGRSRARRAFCGLSAKRAPRSRMRI